MNEFNDERGGDQFGPDRHSGQNTGFVIIRLDKRAEGSDATDLLDLTDALGFDRLRDFLLREEQTRLNPKRVIQRTSLAELRSMEARSLKSDWPYRHSLGLYWRLDLRRHTERESLRDELAAMRDEVDFAYLAAWIANASPSGGCPDYVPLQRYLDAAPTGIDAHWAWSRSRGKGQGVKVIDLESGWNLNHVDLPKPVLLSGTNAGDYGYSAEATHGTQSMGVIAALDDGCGVTGVAPGLDSLDAVSHYVRESPPDPQIDEDERYFHVADAITAAIEFLSPGDILVLEVQRNEGGYYPTEIDAADADAIRNACANGIIVVEAAGNGYRNLATYENAQGKHRLDPGSADFFDSGAIVVGACRAAVTGSPPGHERSAWSNFGARVDCHAWGQDVWTTAGSVGQDSEYTGSFGRTSAATAIIGGACAVIQSWYKAWCGVPLSATQMRQLLSNPNLGTPQVGGGSDPIGVMPDLKRIMNCRERFKQVLACLMRRVRIS